MNVALGILLGAGLVLAAQMYVNDLRDRQMPVPRTGFREPVVPDSKQIMPGVSWAMAHSREYSTVRPVETDDVPWEASLSRMVYAGVGRVRQAVTNALKATRRYIARHAAAVWDHPIVRHQRKWFGRLARPYDRASLDVSWLSGRELKCPRHSLDVRLTVEALLAA